MPDDPAPDDGAVSPARDRLQALAIVCVLAVASLIIAFLGATPARVSATELLGETRAAGDEAFIASHRGGGATAPENTLPAISAALAAGFDYVEVDVALTADRHPVLMHDATVDRTTNGHGRMSALTLAEVQALDAGSWFDAEYAGTRVPTFTEFLDVLDESGHRGLIAHRTSGRILDCVPSLQRSPMLPWLMGRRGSSIATVMGEETGGRR